MSNIVTSIDGQATTASQTSERPRLHKLRIQNFRCIGSTPVEIELDDIVVLVGPNNAGKSSILKAYEVIMSNDKLELSDFPNGMIDPNALPTIELEVVVTSDTTIGNRWIREINGEKFVKERWIWEEPGKAKRQGFDVTINDWVNEAPLGAKNVAKAYRPKPHKVESFSSPEKQVETISKLISQILSNNVKENIQRIGDEDENIRRLHESLTEYKNLVYQQSQHEIQRIEREISSIMEKVFPNYSVKFDHQPENLENINPFTEAALKIGPSGGYQSEIDRQGSGAQRTLLWAALKYIKESENISAQPQLLLLDEPELCLHPNAVREACKVLYDLPNTGVWQVMVTTHSPAFIDLSKDNTTIVRVERMEDGNIRGTTIYRPSKAQLDEDDRERLKLLNICDPYVNEFFFGGRTIIVEGDTEYTAFKHIIKNEPELFKDIHIIRARGKATIVSLTKILNQFATSYAILHDSDTPLTKNGARRNPAWSLNERILNAINSENVQTSENIRLLASVPNFETAYLGLTVNEDKPYHILAEMNSSSQIYNTIKQLLLSLIDYNAEPPAECIEWNNISQLEVALNNE